MNLANAYSTLLQREAPTMGVTSLASALSALLDAGFANRALNQLLCEKLAQESPLCIQSVIAVCRVSHAWSCKEHARQMRGLVPRIVKLIQELEPSQILEALAEIGFWSAVADVEDLLLIKSLV